METRTEKTCCCTVTSCAGGRLDLLFGGIARLRPGGVPKPGGQDLKEIPPEQLYDQAAFVLQDNDLFDATMRRSRSPRMPRAVTASAAVSTVCAPISSAADRKPRAGSCKKKNTARIFQILSESADCVLFYGRADEIQQFVQLAFAEYTDAVLQQQLCRNAVSIGQCAGEHAVVDAAAATGWAAFFEQCAGARVRRARRSASAAPRR